MKKFHHQRIALTIRSTEEKKMLHCLRTTCVAEIGWPGSSRPSLSAYCFTITFIALLQVAMRGFLWQLVMLSCFITAQPLSNLLLAILFGKLLYSSSVCGAGMVGFAGMYTCKAASMPVCSGWMWMAGILYWPQYCCSRSSLCRSN